MTSDKEVALYYPFIDITDAGLVKTSALYWDELQTIVPAEGVKYYQEGTAKEAFDLHFLRPRIVHSGQSEVGNASSELALDLKDEQKKKHIVEYVKTKMKNRPSGRPKHSQVYFEKFNPTHLLHIATDLNQAGIPVSPIDNDRVMLPTPLVDTYMTRLATHISHVDGSVPLTNISGMHNIMLDRYVSYTDERSQNQAQLANLSLSTLSVNPEVSLVDVLRFRDKHREELVKYRREIRRLARQISKGLDTAEKQSLFEEIVKDEIIPVKADIEAKLRSEGGFFIVANTVITVTAAGAILLSGGQGWIGNVLQGAGSIGLNYYANIRAERCTRNHPLGYLYKAQQEFGTNQ